jgi:hypothetical protein
MPGTNREWVLEDILRKIVDSGHLYEIADAIKTNALLHKEPIHISKTGVYDSILSAYEQLKIIDQFLVHNHFSAVWEIDEAFQKKIHAYKADTPFTNIITFDSRYWIVSYASETVNEQDALTAIIQAISRAGYAPLILRCDKSALLCKVISKYFPEIKLDARSHEEYIGQNARIERVHGEARGRNLAKKKRVYSVPALQMAADFCRWNHNFIAKHSELNGLTPANAAGIRYNFRRWVDLLAFTHRMRFSWSLMYPTKEESLSRFRALRK